MLILPAIDLRDGCCVRLAQGDYAQEKIYDPDPAKVALEFQAQGAMWIHVVDLDGAKRGEPQNWAAIEKVARAVWIPIEVGGGIRSLETARRLLALGVRRVIVGTKLVQDEYLARRFFDEFGERVVAGIDARNGKVATEGWTAQTELDAGELAQRMAGLGCKRIILTDIARDGMMNGPNLELLGSVSKAVKVPIVSSGGVGSLADIRLLAQSSDAQPEGVIVGRAIYERKFTIAEAISVAGGV